MHTIEKKSIWISKESLYLQAIKASNYPIGNKHGN